MEPAPSPEVQTCAAVVIPYLLASGPDQDYRLFVAMYCRSIVLTENNKRKKSVGVGVHCFFC